MDRYQRKTHKFKLMKPLDESLTLTLRIEPGSPDGMVIDRIKEHIFRRGKECRLCGGRFNRRDLTIDRRKPISRGGRDNIENLQLLCYECSALKGNNTMLQVRKKLRAQKLNK